MCNTKTALTGFITPRCKLYDEGFIAKKSLDPDEYFDKIKSLKSKFITGNVLKRRNEIQSIKDAKLAEFNEDLAIKHLDRNEEGNIIIHHPYKILKNENTGNVIIASSNPSNPEYRRTYLDANCMRRSVDDSYIIGRRVPLTKTEDGLYKVGKSGLSDKVKMEN